MRYFIVAEFPRGPEVPEVGVVTQEMTRVTSQAFEINADVTQEELVHIATRLVNMLAPMLGPATTARAFIEDTTFDVCIVIDSGGNGVKFPVRTVQIMTRIESTVVKAQ